MFNFGQTSAVIGLDIGSYAVKAVALQTNKDRITLQGYAQARIDQQDPGVVIRQVMEQLGVRAKNVVTSVSGRSVIVRQLELPKMETSKLSETVMREADKYIPFGSEEVIIDAQPLGKADDKALTMPVMLVAVRKTFVAEHIAAAKAGGIQPSVIDVDVFALANAYELFGPAQPPASEKKATALIDLGASKSNIAIVQDNKVLFTREVYLAGNEISEAIARTLGQSPEDVDALKLAPGEALDQLLDAAAPAIEDLANEIRLSFDYVEGQFDVEVTAVVLCGGSAQLPNLPQTLGNILGRPVHVFDPLVGLDLLPSKYSIHGLDANSPALTIALGLAAHSLGFPQAGLGGGQSHQWQPRATRGAVVAAATTDAPAEQQASDEPQQTQPPMQQTVNTVLAPMGTPTPIPAPALAPMPAPATAIFSPPPAQFTPPPMAIAPAPQHPPTQNVSKEAVRSGLLVVLDDDQEMPNMLESERISRPATAAIGTASSVSGTRVVKLDSLDQDADEKDDIGLPPLPKL